MFPAPRSLLLILSIPFTLILSFSAFAGTSTQAQTLTVMTHDSFNISKKVIARFERENKVTVRFLKAGDAGAALVQAILSKNNPLADLFFGVDNSFMSRALKAGIFLPYSSPGLADIPKKFQLDPENRLLPVDYGDVCLNYDKAWFAKHRLSPPKDISDLTAPEYRGLTVVENPATSSPGMAFLLTTIGRFGENGYLEFWKKLRENNVIVANGWEDAYYGHFTSASKGNRPIVVSYASSPPAVVYYSETVLSEAPTGVVVSDGSTFRQIEFVGILKGTKKRKLAEKFVDFMLDLPFQEDIPLQMFVFPTNSRAKLPEVFEKFAIIAENPVTVVPEKIEKNRRSWLEAWTDAVLR